MDAWNVTEAALRILTLARSDGRRRIALVDIAVISTQVGNLESAELQIGAVAQSPKACQNSAGGFRRLGVRQRRNAKRRGVATEVA